MWFQVVSDTFRIVASLSALDFANHESALDFANHEFGYGSERENSSRWNLNSVKSWVGKYWGKTVMGT